MIKNHAPDMILYTGRVIREGPGGAQMIGHVFEHEQWLAVSQMKEMLISGNELNSLWLRPFGGNCFLVTIQIIHLLRGCIAVRIRCSYFTP